MAIERRDPNTIWLGPGSRMLTIVNNIPAGAAIVPGTLLDRVAGEYVAHATAGGHGSTFALNQPELNHGVDTAYADGDLMMAGVGVPGDTFWAWLASGENVADGDPLESNGAGMFAAASTAARTIAKAVEAKDASAGDARIRIEVV